MNANLKDYIRLCGIPEIALLRALMHQWGIEEVKE